MTNVFDRISIIFKLDLFLHVMQLLLDHSYDDSETFCIINIRVRNNEIQWRDTED